MIWLLPFLLLGINFTLWTAIGGLRLLSERLGRSTPGPAAGGLSPDDVAVLIPAHNEELVIASTLASVLRVTAASNVHVIADGCTDDTEKIARALGVNVLELQPAHGKAGGIAAAVEQFDLCSQFEAMLIVDADTELDEHYLERALPMFGRPDVVAVAGYARTTWRPKELRLVGRLLVSYRTRLYALMQWLKYGQTWRWTNVTAIVPGFASMYRTSVLAKMDLNPPGLVIEDFNMTFEIHRKRLGKIAFRPGVRAMTQDPDNPREYCHQVMRWQLGFWQTVRRHGFWRSWFSAALGLYIFEVVAASLLLVAVATAGAVVVLAGVVGMIAGQPHWLGAPDRVLGDYLTVPNLLLFLALPDYLLTCAVALGLRRPSLLLYGIGFLLLRLVDSVITLRTLPQAWRTTSTGRWTSPTRRATGPPAGRPRPTPRAAGPYSARPARAPTGARPAAAAPSLGRPAAMRPVRRPAAAAPPLGRPAAIRPARRPAIIRSAGRRPAAVPAWSRSAVTPTAVPAAACPAVALAEGRPTGAGSRLQWRSP